MILALQTTTTTPLLNKPRRPRLIYGDSDTKSSAGGGIRSGTGPTPGNEPKLMARRNRRI